ncbi:MAG: cell division protein FtsL [Spirochaetia bacterium]|jgi:cell division protein FtsL|nr:cell division protein FtsL [Spirochaetia bacterium]
MRKVLLFLIVATIPGIVFLTVSQVYNYNQIDKEVHSLILDQRELFEQNKRMVANLSILSSPGRIDELAENILELDKRSVDTIRIKIDPVSEDMND